jgi:addiction module HigA family antidote
VIKSFADAETARIWSGRRSRRLPPEIRPAALRKLRMLNQARTLADLQLPPGNRLEALKADRQGFSTASASISSGGSASAGMKERSKMSRSSTTMTDEELLPNPHPGEILAEEFMRPLGLSQNALARSIRVPPRRINELVQGKRAVTADTDLRLARYFGMSEGFFLGLQADHDLMGRKREIAAELEAIQPRAACLQEIRWRSRSRRSRRQ